LLRKPKNSNGLGFGEENTTVSVGTKTLKPKKTYVTGKDTTPLKITPTKSIQSMNTNKKKNVRLTTKEKNQREATIFNGTKFIPNSDKINESRKINQEAKNSSEKEIKKEVLEIADVNVKDMPKNILDKEIMKEEFPIKLRQNNGEIIHNFNLPAKKSMKKIDIKSNSAENETRNPTYGSDEDELLNLLEEMAKKYKEEPKE